jgi:hypothetical protein
MNSFVAGSITCIFYFVTLTVTENVYYVDSVLQLLEIPTTTHYLSTIE